MGVGDLTVDQVAADLEMTRDGVYKLIKRGKLEGVRRSERGLRIPQSALAAYHRSLAGRSRLLTVEFGDAIRAAEKFEAVTGISAADWQRRWKADEIEDTIDNVILTIQALIVLVAEADAARVSGS
jgi:excisionase family DNA binding protein